MRNTVLALTLALGLVPLSAQRPRPDRGPEPPRRGLNLTEDQRKQMEALRTKHREAMEARRGALQTARQALQDEVRKPEASMERLQTLHRELSAKQLDLMLAQRAQRLEVRGLLSPEQRERAERLQGRREGFRMGREGMDRGPRRMGRDEQGPKRFPGRMAGRLGLDDRQREAMRTLSDRHRTDALATGRQLREAQRAFREAMARPDAKVEELRALHAGLAEVQWKGLQLRRAHRMEMEKLLTPEQREKLKAGLQVRGGRRPGPDRR